MIAPFVGVALTRLRRRWRLSLAQWLGLALAFALGLTIALTQALAAEAGFSAVVAAAGPRGVVTVERTGARDAVAYAAFQQQVASRTRQEVGGALREGGRYLVGTDLVPVSLNGGLLGPPVPGVQPGIAAFDGLQQHVRLVAGRWPADAAAGASLEATMAAAGADLLDLRVGDTMCLRASRVASQLLCVRITGLWQPRDPTDPYWGAGVPSLDMMAAPGVVTDVAARLPALVMRAGVTLTPVAAALPYERASATAAGLARLRGYFSTGRGDYFATSLDAVIGDYLASVQARAVSVQVVAAQALGVTVYFVAITASAALTGQRRLLAAWQSRGWSRARTWTLLMVEYGVLLALAAPAGALTAWGLSALVDRVSLHAPLPPPGHVAGTLAPPLGLAAGTLAAVLAVQAWRATAAGGREARARARPGGAWWRWRGADLWLAAAGVAYLGAVALGGLSLGGIADVVLPIAAAVAVALAGLRALGLGARVVGGRRSRVPRRLASIQLARNPAEHARLALLLAFAAGLGVFAGAYAGTTAQDAADQASYRAGADVRALLDAPVSAPRLDDALRGLPAVAASARVFRAQGLPAGTFVYQDVLGVEPETLAAVLAGRPDAPGHPQPSELRLLDGADAGPPLPAGTAGIEVWTDSTGLDAELVAHLAAPGWTCDCRLGDLAATGWRLLSSSVRPPAGTRLTGLEVRSTGGPRQDGRVALSDLAARLAGAGPRVLVPFDRPAGWWRASDGLSDQEAALVPGADPSHDGRPTTSILVQLGVGPAAVRPPPGTQPLPALVSSPLLQRLGLALGQPFFLDIRSTRVRVEAVAAPEWFPTLATSLNGFLVLPREALLARLGRDGDDHAWPNELWLRLDGPAGPVVDRLHDRGDLAELADRGALARAAVSDPLQRALAANLALGFLAAGLLSVGAVALHFFVLARGRATEYAVLRANGLSSAELGGELLVAEGVVLAVGLPLGTGVGALLALTLLPLLTALGTSRVGPPAALAVASLPVGAGLLLLLAASALAGWLAGGLGARVRVADELRGLA